MTNEGRNSEIRTGNSGAIVVHLAFGLRHSFENGHSGFDIPFGFRHSSGSSPGTADILSA
jgi:hypothetical protein